MLFFKSTLLIEIDVQKGIQVIYHLINFHKWNTHM